MKGYGFPVSRQLFLGVRVYPIVSARSLQLNALFLDKDGQLIPSVLTLPTTTAGTMTETEFQCIDGYLLSVTVSDRLGTAKEGEAYCQVFLKMGQVDTDDPIAMLTRGYVSENDPIYYPGGQDRGPNDGVGLIYHATGINPGAGNEYSLVFSAWESVKVRNVRFTLAVDATPANRIAEISLDTDTGNYAIAKSSFAQSLSTTVEYTFCGLGRVTYSSTGVFAQATIDGDVIFQYPVKALGITVINLAAADTITGIVLTLEKFADLRGF